MSSPHATILPHQGTGAAGVGELVRAALPRAAFDPCPERGLIALALVGALLVCGMAAFRAIEHPFAVLPLSALCGGLYASLFFLGHEACHGAILRGRLGQDLIAFPSFLIFILPPTLWRVWHNRVHHGHPNSESHDPDNFGRIAAYRGLRAVRMVAAMTPGSRRWPTLLYLPVWFTVHAQLVLWVQSFTCRGFESLDRKRAALETALMAGWWIALGAVIGARASLLIILLPMLVANAIIMSYISTNHLLRPLTENPDPLDNSLSVTTHPWLDLIHFNFSHHIEHHLFPTMSSRYAPQVRALLRRHAPERFFAPPHLAALALVFATPRIHDERGDLVDPRTGRRVTMRSLARALRRRDPGHPARLPR